MISAVAREVNGFYHPWLRMRQLLGILQVYVALAVLSVLTGSAVWLARSYCWKQVSESFEAMQPALRPTQLVRVDKRARTPEALRRKDVVAYQRDLLDSRDVHFGRIVGLPGDRVSIQKGVLQVNGERPDEPMVGSLTEGAVPDFRVPRGYVFVLVDRRDDPGFLVEDSRLAGPVAIASILGRVNR